MDHNAVGPELRAAGDLHGNRGAGLPGLSHVGDLDHRPLRQLDLLEIIPDLTLELIGSAVDELLFGAVDDRSLDARPGGGPLR